MHHGGKGWEGCLKWWIDVCIVMMKMSVHQTKRVFGRADGVDLSEVRVEGVTF
jgi:hypothetical protein